MEILEAIGMVDNVILQQPSFPVSFSVFAVSNKDVYAFFFFHFFLLFF